MSERIDTESESLLERVRAPFEGPNTVGSSIPFWVGLLVAVGALAAYPQFVGVYTVIQTSRYFALAFLAGFLRKRFDFVPCPHLGDTVEIIGHRSQLVKLL